RDRPAGLRVEIAGHRALAVRIRRGRHVELHPLVRRNLDLELRRGGQRARVARYEREGGLAPDGGHLARAGDGPRPDRRGDPLLDADLFADLLVEFADLVEAPARQLDVEAEARELDHGGLDRIEAAELAQVAAALRDPARDALVVGVCIGLVEIDG